MKMVNMNCGVVGVFLGVFSFLLYMSGPHSPLTPLPRMISSQKATKKKTAIRLGCRVPELRVPKHHVQPSFLASYPGSGTRMQWELTEALTGIPTTDDAFSNGHHNVVGIKTHYPCPAGREFPGAENVLRAVVMVRHPMDTLPAYFDIIHASEQNYRQDQTGPPPPRAPVTDWVRWRDVAFARELEIWRKHFSYWMDRYGHENRLVMSYEHLIDPERGPALVASMANFLRSSEGVIDNKDDNDNDNNNNNNSMVLPDDIPCVWQTIMNRLNHGQPSKPPTETNEANQKSRIVQRRLQSGVMPQTNLMMEPAQQTMGASHLLRQPQQQLLQQVPTNIGASRDQQRPLAKQEMRAVQQQQQQQPRRPENGQEGTPPSQTHSITQSNGQDSDGLEQKQPPLSESGGDTVIGAGGQPSGHVAPMQQGQDDTTMNLLLMPPPSNGIASTATKPKKPRIQDDPDFRPYTEGQRKELVIVLAQLLEVYRDDKILAPILVDYIDQVEARYSQVS